MKACKDREEYLSEGESFWDIKGWKISCFCCVKTG